MGIQGIAVSDTCRAFRSDLVRHRLPAPTQSPGNVVRSAICREGYEATPNVDDLRRHCEIEPTKLLNVIDDEVQSSGV